MNGLLQRENLPVSGNWDTDMARLLEKYARAARELRVWRAETPVEPVKAQPKTDFRPRIDLREPPAPVVVKRRVAVVSSDYHVFD